MGRKFFRLCLVIRTYQRSHNRKNFLPIYVYITTIIAAIGYERIFKICYGWTFIYFSFCKFMKKQYVIIKRIFYFHLTYDIVVKMFSFLTYTDICSLRFICKFFKNMMENKIFVFHQAVKPKNPIGLIVWNNLEKNNAIYQQMLKIVFDNNCTEQSDFHNLI